MQNYFLFLLPAGRPLLLIPFLVEPAGRPGPLFPELTDFAVTTLTEPTGLPRPLFGPKRFLFFSSVLSFDSILRIVSTNSDIPSTKALFVFGRAMKSRFGKINSGKSNYNFILNNI